MDLIMDTFFFFFYSGSESSTSLQFKKEENTFK